MKLSESLRRTFECSGKNLVITWILRTFFICLQVFVFFFFIWEKLKES